MHRATSLANLNDHNEAMNSIEKALDLCPDSADAYNSYGYVLTTIPGYDKNRLETALNAYKKATELRFDYPEAFREQGFILGQLKRDEEALAAYDEALRLRPKCGEAL